MKRARLLAGRALRLLAGLLAVAGVHGQASAQAAPETGSVVVTADRMVDVLAGRVIEEPVGAIAVGRYGDLIAVDGNPLADIRQLESVDLVIKGGAVVSDRRAGPRP